MMDPPGLRNHLLMLADTESEKTKWVVALNELHRILKRNKLPNRAVILFLSVHHFTVVSEFNAVTNKFTFSNYSATQSSPSLKLFVIRLI